MRGAWKSLPCSLLPMKASITTPGYHHSLQPLEWHGELHRGQAPLFDLPNPYVWLAWNAPVHILHLLTMDILGAVFFGFGVFGSKHFKLNWQVGMKPSAKPKNSVKLGGVSIVRTLSSILVSNGLNS